MDTKLGSDNMFSNEEQPYHLFFMGNKSEMCRENFVWECLICFFAEPVNKSVSIFVSLCVGHFYLLPPYNDNETFFFAQPALKKLML